MNDEIKIIKYSALLTLTGNYIAKNGLDISDDDFKKLTQLVDKVINYYDSI